MGNSAIEQIHETSLTLLENMGTRINGVRAKELLLDNGCLFSREISNTGRSDIRSKIKQQLNDIVKNHEFQRLNEHSLEKLEAWEKKLFDR